MYLLLSHKINGPFHVYEYKFISSVHDINVGSFNSQKSDLYFY